MKGPAGGGVALHPKVGEIGARNEAEGCPLVTSPGAFGFTPWVDREVGYYAILAMEIGSSGTDDRPAHFAVDLVRELQPLIRVQLGR